MRATSTGTRQAFLPGFDIFEAILAAENPPPIKATRSEPESFNVAQADSALVAAADDDTGLLPVEGFNVLVDEADDDATELAEPIAETLEVEAEEPSYQPTALILPYGRLDAAQREAAPWPLLNADALADTLTGPVAKFEANMTAIALLRQLEADAREPDDAERLSLQRYTGWGGLKEVFETKPLPEWADRKARLEATLSTEELSAARNSVVNAHYTDLPIVKAMWAGLERLGFAGGRILEPSIGVGHFFGMMPQSISTKSQMHGTELDELSGRIVKKLYGHAAAIHVAGFESIEYPEAWFDLVVSNVPFGNYTVACHRHKPYSKKSIHNYFLGRALDLVRPGGVVAIITSTFFMDGKAEAFRRYVGTRAKLLGAIRLPRKAFAKIASTDVSTDILFLQRRRVGEVPTGNEDPWFDCKPMPADHFVQPEYGTFNTTKNVYWVHRPQMVVGQWTTIRGPYGRNGIGDLVADYSGDNLPGEVQQRIEHLPQGVYEAADDINDLESKALVFGDKALREGEFVARAGQLLQCSEGHLRATALSGKALLRAFGMHTVREHVRALLNAQMDASETDERLNELRRELNRVYDAFVAAHGYLSERSNVRVFRSDPDWPLLLSLEVYDEESNSAEKAAIFSTRTGRPSAAPTRADSIEDALAISAAEAGEVNPTYIGQMMGRDPDDVMAELLDGALVFVNPESGRYETADEYLSGHVRTKLKTARLAGDRYAKNVHALTQALPADLRPIEIDARLGANWVDCKDYEDFIVHLAGAEWQSWHSAKVDRDSTSGAWSITGNADSVAAFKTTWGTVDVTAVGIIARSINGQAITVRDAVRSDDGSTKYVVNVKSTAAARERQAKIEDFFRTWLWEDEARATRLLRFYNDNFNSFVERKFDGSRLRLPGYSWALAPSAHQLNGAARIASGSNTLLGHVVGGGKTLTMAMGSMELRRLGLARKPCHVVPNHMLLQYTAEFMRAYPAAKLLMASKDDLAKERRKAFVARAATNDWDAIVMTHSSFEKLAADPEVTEGFVGQWLAEIKAALATRQRDKEERSIVKQLVKMEKEWEARLERMQAAWKKDDFLTLKMIGIDAVLVDEAHLFKNLFRFSQMERVAGLPASSSQRAFDMLVKTRQIMALNGDRERGIVMSTGTPVANSMAELHVMQRFLQPKTLQRLGLDQFDAWAAQFGRVVNALEVSPDGASFRMNARFAQFVNLPELMGMFGQVADIQTKQMLKLPTPALVGGGPLVCSVKPSAMLKDYIQTLVNRAEAIRDGCVRPEQDNMLAVTNDGRKAALDARLVLPGSEFDAQGKVAACVTKVHELWLKTTDFRGTQLVFSDLGTPGAGRFSIYEDIRVRLTGLGIPTEQIAFIHECGTDRAKEQLFAKVREGNVRVLLGSTQKMGMGTNVQKRLYALHHLDAPWRPADVEQREGRIERRGNDCEAVEIWRYVTEGSFDAYLWQGLAAKAKFIAQVMSGDRSVRRMDDAELSALSYEEVKAIACGNPVVKEKALLDSEYRKLCLLKDHFRDSKWRARHECEELPRRMVRTREKLEAALQELEIVNQHGKKDLVVEGVVLTEIDEITKTLGEISARERIASHIEGNDSVVCVYAGLPLRVVGTRYEQEWGGKYQMLLGKALRQEIKPFLSGKRMHTQLAEAVGNLAKYIEAKRAQIQHLEVKQPILQAQLESTFEHEERMQVVAQRLRELEVELGLAKDIEGAAAMDDASAISNQTSMTAEDAGSEGTPAEAEEAVA